MPPDSYRAAHRYDGAIIQRQRCDEPEPVALRQRDLAIVRDVWRYHFLTTEQLRELWWPGKTPQAARRRLVKLFRGGYLERFRPYSPRGSYEWTYYLAARGHRLLRELGAIDPHARFKPREVFDYGRALHDLQVNAWVLAYRRLLGPALLDWQGEHQLTPPRAARQAQPALDDAWSIEGLRDPQPRPVVPDAALQIADHGEPSPRTFLLEYDRTNRTDKNFDKFRRYDNLVGSWWRHTQLADHDDPPYILFVCQNQAQRDDFLARADQELTGHRWHPSHPTEQHQYIGRRRILFCDERDIHHRHLEARRLPPYPPGHPARQGSDAEIRGVRLPAGGRRIPPEWRHPSRTATGSRSPWPPAQGRTRHSDPASVRQRQAMPKTSGGRRLRRKADGPGPQYSRAYRCPPRARSRERTRRSESQMAALSIELPENVLDALAERVAARVLERLEGGQDGDRWLDAKQAADYLGLSINALHKLTAARQLPAEQDAPGHKLWFRRSQLDHWRSGGHNGAFASKTLPQNSQ